MATSPHLGSLSKADVAISCHKVSRNFLRRERKSGLKAALQAFVNPIYIEKKAVSEMSFEIPRGVCTGIVGGNGAGKTTLLKMIAGLLHPSSGTLSVLGHRPADRNRSFQKRIGMVMGQKSQLWVDIPAAETFELLASIYEIPRADYRRRVDELATTFGVEKLLGVQVRRLSLGERMKLEIIAALLHEPDLLILDEPTIGLDVVSRRTIRRFIREYIVRHDTTVLLSSHDMTDISEVCQKLLLVAGGQIVFDGNLKDFEQRQLNTRSGRSRDVTFLFDLDREPTAEALEEICGELRATIVTREPGLVKLRVPAESIADLVSAVFAVQVPLDLQIESEDLEALVFELMSDTNP